MTLSLKKLVWTPVACLLLTTPLAAQNLSNYLSGPHYNLNIIGVDEEKPPDDQLESTYHLCGLGGGITRSRRPSGFNRVPISACVTATDSTRRTIVPGSV